MKNLNKIAEELFAKIRGRFPEVTIGNEQGNITNEPSEARFFEFPFKGTEADVGKISISLDEENGISVMYSTDVVEGESELTKNEWYNFLKELRKFSKKRMLNFNTKNINKSNLEKRDYKYLAKNKFGDDQMNESKLYGTSRVSYQNVGEARIMIKHTESINQESATGRTQKVGAIYIESADGERFKYPYKHLNGARAMAQHVSEGGKPFDDFGKHITSLSEELSKLRKFKAYMGRSSVMAESLSGYMDVVKERISTVKKTIESLQKPSYYKEAVEGFEAAVLEDVPADVAENWIDQLTIKQFNEELQDVFPYIYKLVSEASKAQELGPEDLVSEDDDPCWKGYKMVGMKKKGKKEVPNCVPEEQQLEAAFEASMGQFSEAANDCDETCPKSCPDCGGTGDPEKYKEMQKDQESQEEGNAYAHAVRKAKMDGKKKGDKVKGPDGDEITLEKEQKTPLGEFILSYFDRETGQFPKGETAVLTMVEKDYGEQFIEPAKAFIEKVGHLVAEKYGYRDEEVSLEDNSSELEAISRLAGL